MVPGSGCGGGEVMSRRLCAGLIMMGPICTRPWWRRGVNTPCGSSQSEVTDCLSTKKIYATRKTRIPGRGRQESGVCLAGDSSLL